MSGSATAPASPQQLAGQFVGQYGYCALTADGHEKQFSRLIYWRDEWYMWGGGRYVRMSEATREASVVKFLQDEHQIAPDAVPRVTRTLIVDVTANIKPHVFLPDQIEPNSWISTGMSEPLVVSVQNGLVLLVNPTRDLRAPLQEHTPDYFTLSCLPFEYDPDAECARWLQFLQEILPDDPDSRALLQQWAGYLFRPDLREQKFLLLSGEGANGKGVFFAVLEALIGPENCSHVPLACFGDRFGLAPTIGKLANMTSESSGMIESQAEAMLKAMTAGDRLTIDRKHKTPIEITPTAKIMIATNDLPRFSDKTRGIWRRILYVPLEQQFTEDRMDKGLADFLIEHELPGIFNWALRGLYWLSADGGFTVPERSRQALAEYELTVNPAKTFLQDNLFERADGLVPSKELYGEYRGFCEEGGYRPLNDAHFGREVRRLFPSVNKTQKRIDGKRMPVYAGVDIRADSELISIGVSSN